MTHAKLYVYLVVNVCRLFYVKLSELDTIMGDMVMEARRVYLYAQTVLIDTSLSHLHYSLMIRSRQVNIPVYHIYTTLS